MMLDLLYVSIAVLFFAIAVAYVAACDRLGGGAPREGNER
jgi:hypothetical protein